MIGIDLFSGAGGMSLGARMANVDIQLAVEIDKYAAASYVHNHQPKYGMLTCDIRKFEKVRLSRKGQPLVIFGGPPCQGFSTSNQRTRTVSNENNWLFREFIRIIKIYMPDWIVFENVKGIIETANRVFVEHIVNEFELLGYTVSYKLLCASDFGVPQHRTRFFIVGSLHGTHYEFPPPNTGKPITVKQAIGDLPVLENGASISYLEYDKIARSSYSKIMRSGSKGSYNHLVTRNNKLIAERYKHIPPGGNWESIPRRLMLNYKDRNRCHTGIYQRLKEDEPSVVIGNYRKNMLVHPTQHRGLSVREAARLQSFPDTYEFKGSIGFQQQQVGNAVPPFLAKAVFESLLAQNR